MEKNGEWILVVDDDRASRRALTRALAEAGYKCRESVSGQEALEMLHAELPSLVLLDFHMPELNGAEVLSRLRSDQDPVLAQLPAIMLTGDGGEESEVRCLEAGANDFVTKPVNVAVLRARIETQLRLQSLRQQLQEQNKDLEAWRENLERDLAAARLTQQSLIPRRPPVLSNWEVATVFRPVIQVGGDIYGWQRMVDGRTLFWIADATGHGAAAALLPTLAKLLFQHGGTEHASAAEIMEAVNNDFRSIFGARSFMTAMCVALDPEKGQATVVGAGHPPLIVMRRQGPPESIASAAPPLGLLEDSRFQETTIQLQPGDAFFLHTDGLYASSRKDPGRRWTPERMETLFAPNERSAAEFLSWLLHRIAPEEKEPLADDLAALMVRRLPG
jgi:serine phosphatase RsbU (regulator of sigma subunit)